MYTHISVTSVTLVCVLPMLSTSSWAQEAGDPGRGLVFAQQACASCHAVLPKETTSPRPNTATFKTIANTPGMTGTAVAVWLQTPHKSMPDLIIEAGDRTDVIAYIVSLRDPPDRK